MKVYWYCRRFIGIVYEIGKLRRTILEKLSTIDNCRQTIYRPYPSTIDLSTIDKSSNVISSYKGKSYEELSIINFKKIIIISKHQLGRIILQNICEMVKKNWLINLLASNRLRGDLMLFTSHFIHLIVFVYNHAENIKEFI